MRIVRRYYRGGCCGATHTPWDEWAGLGADHLTPRSRRMVVLAGASWSFDQASARLAELCGLRVSADLIRRVADAAGARAQRWQAAHVESGAAFRVAAGEVEFSTDGSCVNTRGGWREMRLSVFAKRRPGPPATAAEWAQRKLPAPSARVAFAGIRAADECGAQWAARARQLGVDPQRTPITALADGAKWIWKQVAAHLPQGTCVVDVYHVSEHLHACGRVLHGEQTAAARGWADERSQGALQVVDLLLAVPTSHGLPGVRPPPALCALRSRPDEEPAVLRFPTERKPVDRNDHCPRVSGKKYKVHEQGNRK